MRPWFSWSSGRRPESEGNDAIIDHADSGIAGTRLTVGPDIATMTDREIVDVFNGILAAQERLLAAWDKTVTEEPPGEKQIDYDEDRGQWVPRSDVLRCIIDDGGPDGEVTIHIDDQELSLAEFGRKKKVRPPPLTVESKGRNPKTQAAKALTRQPQGQGVCRRNPRC